jgi:hypothetical protein
LTDLYSFKYYIISGGTFLILPLRLEYEWVKDLGDKLVDIGGRLNWESFRLTLEAIYGNNTERGG